MYNTPPTFPIYVVHLVLRWLKRQGGLSAMAVRNQEKANAMKREKIAMSKVEFVLEVEMKGMAIDAAVFVRDDGSSLNVLRDYHGRRGRAPFGPRARVVPGEAARDVDVVVVVEPGLADRLERGERPVVRVLGREGEENSKLAVRRVM